MMNDLQTLVDTSVIDHPPVAVVDECGLIAGRYRVLRPLGEGGMGNVYLADDLQLARQVAIKTIRPELSGNEEVCSRIKRECRMHAAIGVHPHIVALYDRVEENGCLYLVMEYFAGETLAARLAAAGASGLPPATALDVVRQVLRALICIHNQGIVHRDIKTANILLQQQADGRWLAKLTDFGIARAVLEPDAATRLTSLGAQGPGTPVYMAPERIDPQTFGDVCPASDLYAVGVILFELLTGQPPFKGSMTEIFSGHLVQQPALEELAADLPIQVRSALRTALSKQPAQRFQDAEAFLAALAAIGDPHSLLPPSATVAAPPPIAPVQEPTLLAAEEAEPLPAVHGSTILNPAFSRGRGRSRRSQPLPRRQWAYAVAILGLILCGALLVSRFTGPSSTVPVAADGAGGPAAVAKAADPVPGALVEKTAPKAASALEAVETKRQEKRVEAMAVAGPDGASAASEWQVLEDRSRKIR
jgi:serine/threonine-protein kinase